MDVNYNPSIKFNLPAACFACFKVHTSIIYDAIVQNPFCICQEGLCAAIHFLFNILQCKEGRKRKNVTKARFKHKGKNNKAKNLPSQECKDPLGEKCTLRNRDAALERRASGRVLSTKLRGQRARVRADENLHDTHTPPHPLAHVNMRPPCYQKAASSEGEEEPVEEEIMTGTC